MKHVLVVDDSATARTLVERSLANAGYRVSTAEDGDVALRRVAELEPDLVLLDVAMPALDGWETLAQIRKTARVPVIMLSAHNSEAERVRGLLGGADDYVAKPASGPELAARIAAVLRRPPRRLCTTQVYDDGVVRLDASNAAVTVRGTPVQLTPLELRLLDTLTSNAGAVISARELVKRVWEHPLPNPGERARLYVGYLRAKIERDPACPELVVNVHGRGYRYVAMAPGGVEPPRADSKSAALSAELRGRAGEA